MKRLIQLLVVGLTMLSAFQNAGRFGAGPVAGPSDAR